MSETEDKSEYVIAVKREERDNAPEDLAEELCDVEGLEVQPSLNPRRLQVKASEEAITEVRRRIGKVSHIEPVIPHRPLGDDDPLP